MNVRKKKIIQEKGHVLTTNLGEWDKRRITVQEKGSDRGKNRGYTENFRKTRKSSLKRSKAEEGVVGLNYIETEIQITWAKGAYKVWLQEEKEEVLFTIKKRRKPS